MSFFNDIERDLVVVGRTEVATGVVAIDLASHNGRDLPPWPAGSHLDVVIDDGRAAGSTRVERQYSICSEPADRKHWRIAVLREDAGRGGSVYLHDQVAVGDRLRVRGPRNLFAFTPRTDHTYRFVAGGIGITPLLAMIDAAEAAGSPWTLDYAGRSLATMAFAEDLAGRYGSRVHLHAADRGARLDVAALAAATDADTEVYVCGPARLLDACETSMASAAGTLHLERFEAVEYGEPVWPGPFEVELAASGTVVTVTPEQTVLEAIEEQSPETLVLSSCRRGTCGTCEVPVLEGEIEHRDSVLTPLEREESAVMMVCVSRAACPFIVLDL